MIRRIIVGCVLSRASTFSQIFDELYSITFVVIKKSERCKWWHFKKKRILQEINDDDGRHLHATITLHWPIEDFLFIVSGPFRGLIISNSQSNENAFAVYSTAVYSYALWRVFITASIIHLFFAAFQTFQRDFTWDYSKRFRETLINNRIVLVASDSYFRRASWEKRVLCLFYYLVESGEAETLLPFLWFKKKRAKYRWIAEKNQTSRG